MNHILVKTILVVVSFVVGGAVTFGVMKLTEGSSGSSDDSSTTSNGTRVTDSLKLIVVMSRHGNRGSSVDYPDDPFPIGDVTYWPYGIDQLTNKGRRQEYNLGKRLRSLYNGFLNTTYSTNNINTKSDTVERVIYSGQLVLQGLFPPTSYEVWDTNKNWQPVVVFTNSSDRSTSLDSCARFVAEKATAYSIFEEENAANISTIVNYFSNYSGVTYKANNLSFLFEKIFSEVTEGYTLPSVLSPIYPEPFTDFYIKNFVTRVAGTDEMTRLTIGDLYEGALGIMKSKINGSIPDLKMNYYSAHDSSVINLQVALGIPRSSIVPWVKVGSALVVELHQDSDSGNYYVQVVYIDGSSLDSDPVTLSLPDCGDPCYFDALVNSTQRFINVDFDQECLTSNLSTTPSDLWETFD